MENIMVQLLPVAKDGGKLSEPPSSAEEYLRRVRLEAEACPDITVAKLKPGLLKNTQTRVVFNSSGFIPAPKGFSPTVQCQLKEAANFATLRQKISQLRQQIINDKECQPKLPYPVDESGWCRLCLGPEAEELINSKHVITNTGVFVEPTNSVLPLLSIVVVMKQNIVTEVLELQIGWFRKIGLSPNQGMWLYALLACLQKPLSPDVHAMLRTLARECAALRASLESVDDERLPALNLLITLVARYFDQSDLADNG